MSEREARVRALWVGRPRNLFVRRSAWAAALLVVAAIGLGGFDMGDAASARRIENLARFLRDVRPYPARGAESPGAESVRWGWALFKDRGLEATLTTLALSVAAIVLAGATGLTLAFFAARTLATAEPYLPAPGGRERARARWAWRCVVGVTRGALIIARAVPEYVWAFLFLAMFGGAAWPAVAALALHNMGTLGKLGAETLEDAERAAPTALRALGSSRRQIALVGLVPLVLPRFLLYFFYRWETCVREATVLGMLGFSSLGYWISDARARDWYDEMAFYILLAAALVLLGDMVSALTRRYLRRAA